MRDKGPSTSALFLIPVCLLLARPASAFVLDESLLGIGDPPYVVGDVLSDEQLARLECAESGNGLQVCPVRRYDDRAFAVMVHRADSKNRVKAVLVVLGCEPRRCHDRFEETVAHYTKLLGQQPDDLDGHPIWRDREASHRDLTIVSMDRGAIAVTLLESSP